MSKERINDELTNPELLELEVSLRELSAVGNVNRDELLFEAGRRSTNGRLNSRSGLWKGVSTVLALMLVGQSFLFWSVDDRQIADGGSPLDRSARVDNQLPSGNDEQPTTRITINADLVRQETLPTRRSELLQLRRVALAHGIDVASNPTRLEALQRARDSGRAVATARITLAQGNSEQAGFLIFAPVYAVGTSTETINDRRENLAGYAVGVFRVGDIVDQAMAGLRVDGIELRVIDQTTDKDRQLLFKGAPSPDSGNVRSAELEASSLRSRFDYKVGGRDWQIEFAATPQYILEKSRGDSWLILATGIFSSILLGVVLQLVIGHASQVEELVRLRTEQLRDANSQLEQEVREREQAQQELQDKAAELEKSNAHLTRFNTSASGRELRMIELKRKINELLEASGQPARYDIKFAEK